MTSRPRLCLGTVQFGLSYGITNSGGQVPEVEVARILRVAERSDIGWLDTAQAYGNAEDVLGRQLPEDHQLRLISKLPAQTAEEFVAEDVNAWESAFRCSCRRLGCSSLETFLLHKPADLLKPGGRILEEWLLSLRARGLVQRLGVSIYSAAELEGVNPDLLRSGTAAAFFVRPTLGSRWHCQPSEIRGNGDSCAFTVLAGSALETVGGMACMDAWIHS